MNHSVKMAVLLLFAVFQTTCERQNRSGGVTLYTVRDEMEADPIGTLEEISKLGYRYIEVTGYTDGKFYGMSPEEFKNQLAALDLIPVSSHHSSVTLDNADQMIADVKTVGIEYFVVPIPPMGHFIYDDANQTLGMKGELKTVSDILNTIASKCHEAGIKMLYHNHDFEFLDYGNGVKPMDYFIENSNPEHMNFQLDLYWIIKAGADPLAYFEKYPGRFKMWHVKDMDDQGRFAPVGQGNIDFGEILEKKERSGMEYYIAEQDKTFDGMTPIESVTLSKEGLKKFGFQ